MVSGSSVLYIKHLPPELNSADQEELLKLVGAVTVQIMPNKGKMKYCAFATFPTHEDAKYALSILHQREILGKRLTVEYASEKHQGHVPHVNDQRPILPVTSKEASTNISEREILRLDMEDFSRKLHGISPTLGLDYIPTPLLKYKYPSPTPTIISNISHALVSVPKFYTQVLHLMNKMNLPAPFGPLTPVPPLSSDTNLKVDKYTEVCPSDILEPEKANVTSEESESEYESDSEIGEKAELKILPLKRPLSKNKVKRKVQKVIKATPVAAAPSFPKPRTEPSEVFESLLITQKKISVKKIDQIAPTDPPVTILEPTGGFGAFEASKENKDENISKETADETWDDSRFITSKELNEKRISSREMKTLSIYRNYTPGEVTFRLYIKNLARQVEEKELRYIFGRYIDRNSDSDKNMFDIKLMKEGRMKGQAFVTLATEEQAAKAVKETNGFILHTKPMVVQFARSAKPKEDDKKNKK